MGERIGRVVSYVSFGDKEKTLDFTNAQRNQISSLELAIDHGVAKDPKKARRFIEATSKVLNLPIFKSFPNRSMRATKKALKIEAGYRKSIRDIIKFLMNLVIQDKLEFFAKDGLYSTNPSYNETIEYLSDLLLMDIIIVRLDYSFELALISEILSSADVHLRLGMSINKKSSVQELKRLMPLDLVSTEYFTKKSFTNMTVENLVEFLKVKKAIYEKINRWFERLVTSNNRNFEMIRRKMLYYPVNYQEMNSLFENISGELRKELNKVSNEYGVYRFAQGLCERDIFEEFYAKDAP